MNPTQSDVHVDQLLTQISVAYIQEATDFVAARVFSTVPVQKQSDRYFTYNKGDWFRSDAAERSLSSETVGTGFNVDNTPTYYARVYGVHKDIDDQIRANADQIIDLDRDATMFVTQQLLILRDRLWAQKFFAAGVWTGISVTTADGTPGTLWDAANCTPMHDVLTAQVKMFEQTGRRPNTLVVSPYVHNALLFDAEILDRIKYTQRGVVTADLLAALFQVDNYLVAGGIENTAKQGAADALSFQFGKHALLCYVPPSPSLLTPAAGYTFAWTGYAGAAAYGQRISRLRNDLIRSDRVEGEMAFDQKLVAPDMGALFQNVVS